MLKRSKGHDDFDDDEKLIPTTVFVTSPIASSSVSSSSTSSAPVSFSPTSSAPVPLSFVSLSSASFEPVSLDTVSLSSSPLPSVSLFTVTALPSSILTVAQATITFGGPTFPLPTSLSESQNEPGSKSFSNLGQGAKAGIVVAIIVVAVVIIVLSVWCCCGKALWAKKSSKRNSDTLPFHTVDSQASHVALQASESTQSTQNTQNTQQMREVRTEVDAPPPSYEDVTPMQYQNQPGGHYHAGNDEDDQAIVADGKMPLSEMPFEDVVVDDFTRSSPSAFGTMGLAGRFATNHPDGRGNTVGHTSS